MHQSTSAYFILYNGTIVSWACKKQPITALHSTASEITALHKGATKTVLLQSFLQSIGFPLSSASPTYEDNQGTIKLIHTNCLTNTVCHHAVKIAWLNEHYLTNHIKMAHTKMSLMLADCNTKPVNGSHLFTQISYAIGQHFYPSPNSKHYHDWILLTTLGIIVNNPSLGNNHPNLIFLSFNVSLLILNAGGCGYPVQSTESPIYCLCFGTILSAFS
jgi:hypothetical protein